MRVLHLFAGGGGGILADMLLGHTPIGAVEIDQYCRELLEARQLDGSLPHFPIHDDVTTFDGRPWRGRTDVVAGGFPCQDLSVAGSGAGLDGEQSGLWFEMRRVIREVEPRYVFVENVPGLLVRGMDRVLGDLADLGFDAEWEVLSAADVGAPHLRRRVWILAAHPDRCAVWHDSDADGRRREEQRLEELTGKLRTCRRFADGFREAREQQHPEVVAARMADARRARLQAPEQDRQGRGRPPRRYEEWQATAECGWWSPQPELRRVADGMAEGLDEGPIAMALATGTRLPDRPARLRALGNGQVPACAAAAWRLLMQRLSD